MVQYCDVLLLSTRIILQQLTVITAVRTLPYALVPSYLSVLYKIGHIPMACTVRLFFPAGAAILVPSTTATAAVCILYAILYFTAAIQYRVDAVRVLLFEYSTAL